MANEDAFTLDVAGWVGPTWTSAPAWKRLATLQFVAERAKYLKRVELAKGVGVDGRQLAPVKKTSRPDGATGKPLVPHRGESRSVTRMRSSVGAARGTVAIWWSHSWGSILGYHADGLVRGAPVRDVIGLTAGNMRGLEFAATTYFRSGVRIMPRPEPVLPIRPKIDAPRPLPTPTRIIDYIHADSHSTQAVGRDAPRGPITRDTGFRQFR